MSLRKSIIRLAHTQPELQKHLLPLLKTSANNVVWTTLLSDAWHNQFLPAIMVSTTMSLIDRGHKANLNALQDVIQVTSKYGGRFSFLLGRADGWPGPRNITLTIQVRSDTGSGAREFEIKIDGGTPSNMIGADIAYEIDQILVKAD